MAQSSELRSVVGCDIQSVAEVAEALEKFGERYVERIQSRREQESGRSDPGFLARRFAGKEAVLKVLGEPDGVDLRSIEILQDAAGRPTVLLSGRAAELARARGLTGVDVSLSSSAGVAFAVASAIAVSTQLGA